MADYDDKKGDFYAPPPKISNAAKFRRFLYNSETGEFLGRTPMSWAKIIIFYIIFYICLAAFWYGLWQAFLYFRINDNVPTHQLSGSLIGQNPGLGFRPMPMSNDVDSALVWYKRDDSGFLTWTKKLEEFLDFYQNTSKLPFQGQNLVNCAYGRPAPPEKACKVPLTTMHPCNGGFYSYDKGSPCIFLKLNKIFNWVPEYYNDSNNIPHSMPKDLVNHIRQQKREEMNTVWISCEGENPADKENIGSVNYLPRRGFPEYYFPYKGVKGYLSPLVAIWFDSPKPGVLINVECKAWAKNIEYDRHDRRGSVHFEIMID